MTFLPKNDYQLKVFTNSFFRKNKPSRHLTGNDTRKGDDTDKTA